MSPPLPELEPEAFILWEKLLLVAPKTRLLRFDRVEVVEYNRKRFLALHLPEPDPDPKKQIWIFFHPDGCTPEEMQACTELKGLTTYTGVDV